MDSIGVQRVIGAGATSTGATYNPTQNSPTFTVKYGAGPTRQHPVGLGSRILVPESTRGWSAASASTFR